MHNLNNNNKNNAKVTTAAATLFTVATIVFATTTMAPSALASRFGGGEGFVDPHMDRKAPAVVSGDNIYIAWWTNNTENNNEEVMFRASTDGGATFGDRINLSNTTDADSWRVEISGEGDTVVVSWWETTRTNQTTNQTGTAGATANQTEGAAEAGAAAQPQQDIPVMRVSNDAGETFGPVLMLATNGTIGVTEEEEEAAAAETEGGVEEEEAAAAADEGGE
jgi:hypothetical protein